MLKALAARPGILKAEEQDDGPGGMWWRWIRIKTSGLTWLGSIIEKGWGLLEMHSQELSLEEVFVQLVTEEPGDSHEGV